jgi:CobQ-like glutamine amidotransferase family enzyme
MNGRQLNILWMYPDILNLHGDRGNVAALVRICEQLGIEARLKRVNRLTDRLTDSVTGGSDISNADLILLNPGELIVMPAVIHALSEKKEALQEYAAAGKGILAVGTTGAVLAQEIVRQDGSVFEGLGLLDMKVNEREAIYGDDIIFRLMSDADTSNTKAGDSETKSEDAQSTEEPGDVCGIQIRTTDTFLAENQKALGRIVYGLGNSGESGTIYNENVGTVDSGANDSSAADSRAIYEGAVRENIIFTNALGPVLVKNPWFARRIIESILKRKYPNADIPAETDAYLTARGKTTETLWDLERKSARAIAAFNKNKKSGLS